MMLDESVIAGFITGMLSVGAAVALSVTEVVDEPLQASNALNVHNRSSIFNRLFVLLMRINLRLQF